MAKGFFGKFSRVTYSTNYLPQVDGLRFLAIFSVVVVMHITGYMHEKFYNDSLIAEGYWQRMVTGGGGGVSLFFMISGFILSLPFAKWRLNGDSPVPLRNYYLRRLTRLEPPYAIALLIFFIAHVWVIERYSFEQLLPRFFASLTYLHTLVYKSFSPILPAAWSLEVEVQFYLLAPLLFTIFTIRRAMVRWVIQALVIVAGALYWFDTWTLPHLFKFIHYFFCGILLADLYCSRVRLIRNEELGAVAGMAALLGFIFIPSIGLLMGYLLRLACMFLLFHTVLTNTLVKRVFSWQPMVMIGGMCYSIYLLHFAVVSFAGTMLLQSGIDVSDPRFFPVFAIVMSLLVLVVSGIYFLLVEKPFMKPRGLRPRKQAAVGL